jgi:Zn-dependent protease
MGNNYYRRCGYERRKNVSMVKCDRCGVETYMPFRCKYCGGYFCDQHRLPEFHNCTGAYAGPREAPVQIGSYTPSGGFQGQYTASSYARPYWFSRRELRDLAVGLAVIMFVPLLRLWEYLSVDPLLVIGAVTVLTLAFMLHEIAHKFAAQRAGLWAEFRLSSLGLMLTLLSFFLFQTSIFPLMIVAPGAVMIAGVLNWSDYGRISIAGPATNIAQALIYFVAHVAAVATDNVYLFLICDYGMIINSTLALFNLIPFGMFDGLKIFKWNRGVWLAAVVAAGALLLYVTIFEPTLI